MHMPGVMTHFMMLTCSIVVYIYKHAQPFCVLRINVCVMSIADSSAVFYIGDEDGIESTKER